MYLSHTNHLLNAFEENLLESVGYTHNADSVLIGEYKLADTIEYIKASIDPYLGDVSGDPVLEEVRSLCFCFGTKNVAKYLHGKVVDAYEYEREMQESYEREMQEPQGIES